MWWGAALPTMDELFQCNAFVWSMIMLNIVNPIGAGVRMDGSAVDAWSLLVALHDVAFDLGLIHA